MNFRRILSKSSLKKSKRTSLSSAKSLSHSEELSELYTQIETLKRTVESMKQSLEYREVAIGNLVREKDTLFGELKNAQRTNRNLQQQLLDERDIHSKEKEYLINEIKKLKKSDMNIVGREFSDSTEEKQLINSMREEIKAKDEIICNVCVKYLKIKSSKKIIQKKFKELLLESKKICENVILLLEENRNNLDNLLKNLIKSPIVALDTKRFLRLLKVNASLHFENTQLKICVSQNLLLGNDVEKLHGSTTQHKFTISEANLTDLRTPQMLPFFNGLQTHKVLKRYNISNRLRDAYSPHKFKPRIYSSAPSLTQ